jgi:hypothetical protein
MAIAEELVLKDGISGPAGKAASAVNRLAAALKAVSGIKIEGNNAGEIERLALAAAAGKVAQQNAKAHGAVEVNNAKVAGQMQLQQQKAVQQAILAAQKNMHAQRLADIKSEAVAQKAAIKDNDKAAKDAIKSQREEERKARDEDRRKREEERKALDRYDRLHANQAEKPDMSFQVGGAGGQARGVLENLGMGTNAAGAIGLAINGAIKVVGAVYEAYQQAVQVLTAIGGAGINMAIAATSSKEKIEGVLESLGKSHAASKLLYEQIAAISVQTGRDKDVIAGEFTRMIKAGFKDDQVGQIVKVLGDVSAVGGEGKAAALEKLLTRVQAKGSLDKAVVTGLIRQGVSQEAFYKELAKVTKKGADQIPALIKTGKISSQDAEAAILAAVGKTVKGAAEKQANTVLALIARIKSAAEEMFALDERSVKPVKDFLNNVLKMITSGPGQALKAAIQNLFGAVFSTAFDDLNSKAGKSTIADAFTQITRGVNMAAEAIRQLKPEVQAIIAMFKQMMHDGTIPSMVKAMQMTAKAKLGGMQDDAGAMKWKVKAAASPGKTLGKIWTDPLGELDEALGGGVKRRLGVGTLSPIRGILRQFGMDDPFHADDGGKEAAAGSPKGGAVAKSAKAMKASVLPDMMNAYTLPDDAKADAIDKMTQGGTDIGGALNDGMAQGIIATMDQAIAAGGASAEALIARVRAALGVHSPSTVFAEIGGFLSEGMAQGIAGGQSKVNAAVGKMGAGAASAVVPGAGGAGGAANDNGKAAGGGTTIEHLEIHANDAEGGRQAAEEFSRALNAKVRRVGNEG